MGSPIPTVFCFADTVILLQKHTTFSPLILLALLTYIQAHRDSIDNPRYQPPPHPQPRRCRLSLSPLAVASRCRPWKPWLTTRLYSCRYTLRRTFFGIFTKGEKCCQFLVACYVYIVLMKLFTTPRSQSLPVLLLLLPPSPSQPSPPPPLPLLLLQPSL
jgi:hypothetical protein